MSGKSKDEQIAEKKQELEKRLQDVTGQLGHNTKKGPKKGEWRATCWSVGRPAAAHMLLGWVRVPECCVHMNSNTDPSWALVAMCLFL